MLEKPNIPDETIVACLRAEYDLRIQQIDFLPLGGDLSTAVYRAVADNGKPYYCKLRFSNFDEIAVEVPRLLYDQGIAQIIPPLRSNTGRLWVDMGAVRLILYPFIEGKSGCQVELNEAHWRNLSAALWKIHATSLPQALASKVPGDTVSPYWRDLCRELIGRVDRETSTDPITKALVDFLSHRRNMILDLVNRSEELAKRLAANPGKAVLCHGDVHPGNLYIDTDGELFIVDWDYPKLAPRERDLIFIGGGHGFIGRNADEENHLFYRFYDPSTVNLSAMAYYRCEQNIIELGVQIPRILSSEPGEKDRVQSLEITRWLFQPGGTMEMTWKTLERLDEQNQ